MISEQELLQQAKDLDQRALADIYDCYSPRLYRYAFRLLGDTCGAEDCVAETFSRFIQSLSAGRGPHNYLQAYLFRTAHNIIVDHYRRRPTETLDEHLPDRSDVETDASNKLRQQSVRDAMCKLSAAQQQVVALKFLEGWENEEIAFVLRKPVGAVKSLQHRALSSLQKLLSSDES